MPLALYLCRPWLQDTVSPLMSTISCLGKIHCLTHVRQQAPIPTMSLRPLQGQSLTQPACQQQAHGSTHGEKHSIVSQLERLQDRQDESWNPKFLQIRPLVGISALCLTIACIFASLAVLVAADGQATVRWAVSSPVYLAIITAISNSSLALAYMEGTPVSVA